MSAGLELYESRISRIDRAADAVEIHFSHAAIYKARSVPGRDPGTRWSQEAVLLLAEAAMAVPGPALPNMVVDGYLEVDGVRHEIIPLPLGERAEGRVHLEFADGSTLDVMGRRPTITLLGQAIRLKEYL